MSLCYPSNDVPVDENAVPAGHDCEVSQSNLSSILKSGRKWPSGPWHRRAGVHLGYAVEDLDEMTEKSNLIPKEEAAEIRDGMSGLSTTLKEKEPPHIDVVATIEKTEELGNQLYLYGNKPTSGDLEGSGINDVTQSLRRAHEALLGLESASCQNHGTLTWNIADNSES
ncbi:uncharacterized protein L203_102294 [Cryptococcus depauperatus CBS 7841]|uniref:Uncharacterized protein n=1 Tax=Cryptococcus depauperatus CBS 7841 TaxID=1295531 RepID=A0A1E3IA83_9TREE|nr:hypothetical protein L203_04751 [Cryptococcus depauperatus CBS 7841]